MREDRIMDKKCNFCGNKNVSAKTVQYVYKRGGRMLIVDNVPCEQCDFCGEQYFEASVLKKIEADADAVFSHKKKPVREMLVPVESF